MLRSLFSGISGLHAHQQMIDVTGNNIANVNTAGFKSQQVQFKETLSQMVGAAGSPQNGQAGTNPAQIGLGVRVGSIGQNFTQGSAQTTGKSGDMMIQGDGFFMTRSGGEILYTRAGAFGIDANGVLCSSTGEPVQGWTGVDGVVNAAGNPGDIRIPLGDTMPPVATSRITLKGNLTSDLPSKVPMPLTDTVSIPVKVYDAAGATSTITVQYSRPLDSTKPASAQSTSWKIELLDSNNNPIKDASNNPVTGTIDMAGGKPTLFAGTGAPPAGQLDGDGMMTVGDYKLNMADLTMYSGNTDARVFQTDGQNAGALTSLSFTVSETGQIIGVYNNGLKQVLGQVSMATFANPEGLERVGNSMFRTTVNSGYAQVGQPGSAGMGSVLSGALEMSNVDLAQEFTNLVVAQRGFQANSKIITTSDELLQELVSMKR